MSEQQLNDGIGQQFVIGQRTSDQSEDLIQRVIEVLLFGLVKTRCGPIEDPPQNGIAGDKIDRFLTG